MERTYVLNYFPIPGRAEPARLMFHLAGVKFTDNLIAPANWAQERKDSKRFPLGQMPSLEFNDQVMVQALAINRFLADEFGYHGTSNTDRAIIAQVTETFSEIQEAWVKIKKDPTKDNEAKKSDLAQYFGGDFVHQRLKFIEDKVDPKAGQFLLGEKVSLADIHCFCHFETATSCNPSSMGGFPKLTELCKAISELEPIKKYLQNRTYDATIIA